MVRQCPPAGTVAWGNKACVQAVYSHQTKGEGKGRQQAQAQKAGSRHRCQSRHVQGLLQGQVWGRKGKARQGTACTRQMPQQAYMGGNGQEGVEWEGKQWGGRHKANGAFSADRPPPCPILPPPWPGPPAPTYETGEPLFILFF